MSRQTLSVIMPNYNDAKYISVALEAILSQSFQPIEVIVIDDGSTDDSVQIIKEFARKNPCINFLRNELNMGIVYSVNRAMQIAIGEYIYFASANDMVLPGFFEKSMALLEKHPQAGLCCSDPAILDCFGNVKGRALSWAVEPSYISPWELVGMMNSNRSIWGFSVIMKRLAFEGEGGLHSQLRWSCDFYLNYVIAFKFGICYVPESLATSRTHDGSYSSGMVIKELQHEVNDRILMLLNSPAYHDILPLFKSSGVLMYLPGMLFMLASKSDYWNYLSPTLLPRLLQVAFKCFFSRVTPPIVKDVYRKFKYKKI